MTIFKCDQCGKTLERHEAYTFNGTELCAECFMKEAGDSIKEAMDAYCEMVQKMSDLYDAVDGRCFPSKWQFNEAIVSLKELDMLAAIMNCAVVTKEHDEDNDMLYFTYRGVKFWNLGEKVKSSESV